MEMLCESWVEDSMDLGMDESPIRLYQNSPQSPIKPREVEDKEVEELFSNSDLLFDVTKFELDV